MQSESITKWVGPIPENQNQVYIIMLTQNQLEVLGAAYEAIEEITDYGIAKGIKTMGNISQDTAWVSTDGVAEIKIQRPFIYGLISNPPTLDNIAAWKQEAIEDIKRGIENFSRRRICELENELEILKRSVE